MEFLFKKHFWLVHLAFLFAVAFFIARTVNGFVEAEMVPLPQARAAQQQAVEAPPAMLSFERVAKVLGLPGKVEVLVQEPVVPKVDMNAAPVHTTLNLKLLGTMVAENVPEVSVASIQDVSTLKVGTYRQKDLVQNCEVLEIERKRVIILNNGRKEYIDEVPGTGGPAPMPVVAAPPPPMLKPSNDGAPPSVALGGSIKQVSENDYEIPRAEIDKTLSNLNDVAMQARIVPAFKDGQAQGFKLFSIRPDSIYTKIGIQNGDVIKRINGYEMNSPEKALEIYSKLKEASRIDIEVERNGASVRKTYNVR